MHKKCDRNVENLLQKEMFFSIAHAIKLPVIKHLVYSPDPLS